MERTTCRSKGAMGSKIGPEYAWIHVGHLKEQLLSSYTGPTSFLYKRHTDDIVGVMEGTGSDLELFIVFIKLSTITLLHMADNSVNVFDITLTIDSDHIATKISRLILTITSATLQVIRQYV